MPVWETPIGTRLGAALGKVLVCQDAQGRGRWEDPQAALVPAFKSLFAGTAVLLSTDAQAQYAIGHGQKARHVTAGTVSPVVIVSDVPTAIPTRIAYAVAVNATAPGQNLKLRVCPFTLGGGANQITFTIGAPVAGLSVDVASGAMTANSVASGVGPAFAGIPAGNYVVTFEPAAAIAAGSALAITLGFQAQYL